jgi:hypothetical protein
VQRCAPACSALLVLALPLLDTPVVLLAVQRCAPACSALLVLVLRRPVLLRQQRQEALQQLEPR